MGQASVVETDEMSNNRSHPGGGFRRRRKQLVERRVLILPRQLIGVPIGLQHLAPFGVVNQVVDGRAHHQGGLIGGPVALNRGEDRIAKPGGNGADCRNGEGAGAATEISEMPTSFKDASD